MPRAGGYAIWAGFLPAALAFAPAFPGGWIGWLPAWAALPSSRRSTTREVRVVPRLAVHAAAALWAAAWLLDHGRGSTMPPRRRGHVAAALVIAWSANLYNFMDGTDGLAATMAPWDSPPTASLRGARHGPMAGAPSPHASAPAFFALAAATSRSSW